MRATYDYVIVGGGTAGCVLANRLTEEPGARVLLAEAGGRDLNPFIHVAGGVGKLFGPRVNWRFHTVPQSHLDGRRIWYPQGRTLGGSSSINAMIYIRGQREDYDGWAALGNSGWSYEEVLPYFRKSEDNSRLVDEFHGQGGPQAVSDQVAPHVLSSSFVRAAHAWGLPYNHDFNGATMFGAGLYQVTYRAGIRKSQAVAFLRPARHRPNLDVRVGTSARRVVIDHGRAAGVELVHRGKQTTVRAEREVLLCAGSVNTARLLLVSGIGPPAELRAVGVTPVHDLPGVGRNLRDHLNTNVHLRLREPISYDGQDRFPRALGHGLRWAISKTGPAASVIVEGGGFFCSDGADRPDMQIHIAPALVVRGGQTDVQGPGFTVNSTFLRPHSVGRVTLRSPDPAAAPLIDPNYHGDPRDRQMSVTQVHTIREVLSEQPIAEFIERELLPGAHAVSDEQILAYARRYASCDYHPVGTARMGNDEQAVVDPQLRVRGLDGLRVIDASVMPTLPSGNTMAPTMMIAEKGADLVRFGAQR